MGTRWTPAAGIAVLLLTLTACAGRVIDPPGTSAGPPRAGSAPRGSAEQEKVNRKQAEDEVRRLLGLAPIPPGAVALGSAPAALPGPALGTPNESTYASLARFWRVPMASSALDGYVRHHPPAGLTAEGSTTGFADGSITQGYAWRDAPSQHAPQGGQLSIGVAGSDDVSYLRVDAGAEWLDPHPVRDSTGGARLRLETGQRCPGSDRGIAGVRNDGADDLDGALVPNGTPAAGQVCVYAGLNGQAFTLLRQRPLSRAVATRVATAARSVGLAHANGVVRHCPGRDGPTMVVVLSYPSRPAVNLWIDTGGCQTASNGHVVASGTPSLAALVDLVNQVAG